MVGNNFYFKTHRSREQGLNWDPYNLQRCLLVTISLDSAFYTFYHFSKEFLPVQDSALSP